MNTSQSSKNPKKRAQALVEFALIVPVLMVILYGVIETGRYLFIYASTITAARQATRYGTALGTNAAGTNYYNDCVGIETAARKVEFLNKFQSISIKYDGGLLSNSRTPNAKTPNSCPNGGNGTLVPVSGDRVIVEVTAQYSPIISLLPFKPFLVKSTSARTIISEVSIYVPPVVPNQGLPVLSIDKASGASWVVNPNVLTGTYSNFDPITFKFRFTNSGNGTGVLNPPFTVDTVIKGNTVTTTCTGAPASLARNNSFDCAVTYAYTPTQADLDAGSFEGYAVGKAYSNGNLLTSVGVQIIFTALQTPSIRLDSITPDVTSATSVGAIVHYTYTFTNTGNVSINAPFTITDDHVSSITCSATTVAPLASTSCIGTYAITQKDIDDELLINTATVKATYGAGGLTTPASNSAQASVKTGQFFMTVTASPSPASAYGQVITFTYTIFNNSGGSITVSGVTHQNPGVVINSSCINKTVAYPSALTCTGTYNISTTDYETLPSIDDVVYATRTVGTPTKSKSTSVSLVQVKKITLSLSSVTPSQPAGSMIAGTTTITYVYTLKNDGNVTLAAPFTINNGTVTTCSSISSLAPPSSANCTVVYTVTQADLDNGTVTKVATANATFGGSPTPTSDPLSTMVITYPNARFKVGVTVAPTTPITTTGALATFTYTITNTGGRDLTTFNLTTSQFGTFSCAGTIVTGGPPITCTQTKVPTTTITDTISAANAKDGLTTVTSTNFTPSSATAYLCTSATLKFTGTIPRWTNSSRTATWSISNTVGLDLTINRIELRWSPTSIYLTLLTYGLPSPATPTTL